MENSDSNNINCSFCNTPTISGYHGGYTGNGVNYENICYCCGV